MAHQNPYTPNFPPSQGQGPPYNDEKGNENHPMLPQAGYPAQMSPGPYPPQISMPMPQTQQPMPQIQQPMPMGMQVGYQPGFQPGFLPTQQSPGYAVMVQPGPQAPPGGLMAAPQIPNNCPPGLEYLTMIDQLLIHQKVELLEALVGFETKNKYTIKNRAGQKVYFAGEENDCCTRMMCGKLRPFEMVILDNFSNEVMHLSRPLACMECCFFCCLQSIEVSAPPGNVIGTVQQECSLIKPNYSVRDAAGEIVLQIKGPLCPFSICGGSVKFNVFSKDGKTKVGKISKSWSGLARELFTDSDYFGIEFPMDLDVKVKALLLGAVFLIDFMYFEQTGGNN